MIRSEIDEQIAEFLSGGGEVDSIDRGTSGRSDLNQALPPQAFNQPKVDRTSVSDVISNIEARKKPVKAPSNRRNSQPKREVVLDDFGEPLRWKWKED